MLKNCYVFLTPQPLVVRKIQESKCLKKKRKNNNKKSLDNYSFLIWTVLCPT